MGYELLPLAIERGVTGFTHDPRAIERYGREVAPALREALALARGRAASA